MSGRASSSVEGSKHAAEDRTYYDYIARLSEFFDRPEDIITQFPAFVGYVNLARYLSLYDLYKRVAPLNGHIADVGTFKGASLLFFAKLVRLFEPSNMTVVPAMNRNEIGAKLRRILTENRVVGTADIDETTDLFAAGVMDSFQVVATVVHIEEVFGLALDEGDLTEVNFRTLDSLIDLIAERSASRVV